MPALSQAFAFECSSDYVFEDHLIFMLAPNGLIAGMGSEVLVVHAGELS